MRDKVKRFCKEYIVDNIGTKAAIRAGYEDTSAHVQASRLLAKEEVQEYIAKLIAKQSKRTEITADAVLEQYRRLAFADVNDYYHTVYELIYPRTSSDKEYQKHIRKYHRLKKWYGYTLTEDVYSTLPTAVQSHYRPDEVLKPFDLMTKEQRAAIQGITYDKAGNPILKLSTKETSLDALAKHLGIFEKDNRQKGINVKVEQRTLDDFYDTETPKDK